MWNIVVRLDESAVVMEKNQAKIVRNKKGLSLIVLFFFTVTIFVCWMFWLGNEKPTTSSTSLSQQTVTIKPTSPASNTH
jgi:hypothetical protein